MPRETIKGEMFDTHVGWSDGTVQLGIETSDKTPLVKQLNELSEATSVWSTLNEDDIDRLILVLNRVRYRAYDQYRDR